MARKAYITNYRIHAHEVMGLLIVHLQLYLHIVNDYDLPGLDCMDSLQSHM